MDGIGGFLERYKNFLPPRLAAARALQAAIQETAGIDVGEKNISIRNGRATVTAEGLVKTEILLHKEVILQALKKKIGASVRDIN